MDQNLKPLVSVIMCCYNAEKYIAETIESVLHQTYTNFEFIIWNDGSTDSTEQIIETYNDCRIRYFYHENTGLGKALNLACLKGKGKYIARIDADDICLLNRIEIQVQFLESHPQYILISSSVYYIDENGCILGRSFPYTKNFILQQKMKWGSPVSHPATMFNRDVYLKTCGYIDIAGGEDRILFAKMCKFGKIKNIAIPLIKYRLLFSSLSHRQHQSPYLGILEEYRTKIINDDFISLEDIDLHNKIYHLRKQEQGSSKDIYRKSYEEHLFSAFKVVIGERGAQYITTILKNAYGVIIKK